MNMHKNVIITGANGNLGSVVTRLFLDKGYKVIATVRSEESVNELPASEGLEVIALDLNDEKATENFIADCVSKYKSIDAALLLVGGFAMGNIAATKMGQIKDQIALNFETAYHVAQPLYQHMAKQNQGKLVFIGARPAIKAADGKNMIAYALGKSLLFSLAGYINAEGKGKNITASVIVPSTIDTVANRQSMPGSDPGNWVKPKALADILEFIVSSKSDALRETVLKVYNNA